MISCTPTCTIQTKEPYEQARVDRILVRARAREGQSLAVAPTNECAQPSLCYQMKINYSDQNLLNTLLCSLFLNPRLCFTFLTGSSVCKHFQANGYKLIFFSFRGYISSKFDEHNQKQVLKIGILTSLNCSLKLFVQLLKQ